MPQLDPQIQKRIAAATDDLAIAEKDLKAVLDAMATTARADKKIIGSALQSAFDRVVKARKTLASALEEH